MDQDNNSEGKKRFIRIISFLAAIILGSHAIMAATLIDNTILLAIVAVPCVITLSVSIIPVPLSSKKILLCGIISSLVSLIAIVYVIITHPQKVKEYLVWHEPSQSITRNEQKNEKARPN